MCVCAYIYTNIHTYIQKQDRSSIIAVGIKEFPYTYGGDLEGSERLIEREMWFFDEKVAAEGGSCAPYVVMHVHFSGRWHDDESQRDW